MCGVLTRSFATYTYILTSVRSTVGHPCRFSAHGTLRYHATIIADHDILSFGTMLEPRYIFGALKLDQ